MEGECERGALVGKPVGDTTTEVLNDVYMVMSFTLQGIWRLWPPRVADKGSWDNGGEALVTAWASWKEFMTEVGQLY